MLHERHRRRHGLLHPVIRGLDQGHRHPPGRVRQPRRRMVDPRPGLRRVTHRRPHRVDAVLRRVRDRGRLIPRRPHHQLPARPDHIRHHITRGTGGSPDRGVRGGRHRMAGLIERRRRLMQVTRQVSPPARLMRPSPRLRRRLRLGRPLPRRRLRLQPLISRLHPLELRRRHRLRRVRLARAATRMRSLLLGHRTRRPAPRQHHRVPGRVRRAQRVIVPVAGSVSVASRPALS